MSAAEPDWASFDLPAPQDVADADLAAKALLRLLHASGPADAGRSWADSAGKRRLAGLHGGGAHWFEEKRADGTSVYTYVGDGVGRFQHQRPTEAELAAAPLIVVAAQPPAPLRAYLARLVDRLPESNVVRRDRERLFGRLDACDSPLKALMPQMAFLLKYAAALRGPAGAARELAEATRASTAAAFEQFEMPGPMAFRLILLSALLARVEQPPAAWLDVLAATPPHQVLRRMLEELFKLPGAADLVVATADELAEQGQARVTLAAEEGRRSCGLFVRHVFASGPLFSAAFFACRWLLDYGTIADAKKEKLVRQRAIGYEEETVLSVTALDIDTGNAIDRRFLHLHRARIERARREGGAAAAEIQWSDYAGRQRFYPALWKAMVMGETDRARFEA